MRLPILIERMSDAPDRVKFRWLIGTLIAVSILFAAMPAWADTQLVSKARSYIGMSAKQVGVRRTLWCSAFIRKIAGSPKGVDDRAISWTSQRHVAKQIGAIAIVRSRRMHVGVVSGFDRSGNPIIVSGNHGNRVAEAVYPKSRVIAYVAAPADRMAMVR